MQNFHHFKVFKFEDPSLNAKIEDAEKSIRNINQARRQVANNLQDRKYDRDEAALQLKNLSYNNYHERSTAWEKREMEYLQQALDELYGSKKQRAIDKCLEEAGINDLLLSKQIKSLSYQIKHGSNNLAAEKRILRQIEEAEAERGTSGADVYLKVKSVDNWGLEKVIGSKEAIEDRIKLISNNLREARKAEKELNANLKCHREEQLELAENAVRRLQKELEYLTRVQDEVYERIFELTKAE